MSWSDGLLSIIINIYLHSIDSLDRRFLRYAFACNLNILSKNTFIHIFKYPWLLKLVQKYILIYITLCNIIYIWSNILWPDRLLATLPIISLCKIAFPTKYQRIILQIYFHAIFYFQFNVSLLRFQKDHFYQNFLILVLK